MPVTVITIGDDGGRVSQGTAPRRKPWSKTKKANLYKRARKLGARKTKVVKKTAPARKVYRYADGSPIE